LKPFLITFNLESGINFITLKIPFYWDNKLIL
jgi:hypothetical protein